MWNLLLVLQWFGAIMSEVSPLADVLPAYTVACMCLVGEHLAVLDIYSMLWCGVCAGYLP